MGIKFLGFAGKAIHPVSVIRDKVKFCENKMVNPYNGPAPKLLINTALRAKMEEDL